jgi:hypothetical protein
MGKQNMAGLLVRTCFQKTHIHREKSGDSKIVPSLFWCYALSHSVLLDSGGPRIRIKQIHFMNVVQLFIPASSVHIHFDRRSNTLQRGYEKT